MLDPRSGAASAFAVLLATLPLTACGKSEPTEEQARVTHLLATGGAASAITGLAGKCLDVTGAYASDGTAVELWDCNGGDNQRWSFEDGAIVGLAGKCLDVRGGDSASGTPVQLWPCNGTDAQKWTLRGAAIVGPGGKCLDVQWGNSESGTPVQIWDCNGTPAQTWNADPGAPSGGSAGGGGAGAGDVGVPPIPSVCGVAPTADTSQQASYPTGGRTFYIAPAGNDDNDGLSAAAPFAHAWRAASQTLPGDTVLFRSGVYDGFSVSRSGAPGAYVVYMAMPGEHPKLAVQTTDAIYAVGVSYVVVDGFEVEGNRANVTYDYALSHPRAPETSANGITFHQSHHVVIRNNDVHDVCGGGIDVEYSDYILVDHNRTHENAYWSVYGGSGISLGFMTDIDSSSETKNVVSNNVSYGNEEFLDCLCSGSTAITDGNGIIIDSLRHQTDGHPEQAYQGRTLVVNNLAYDNGGTGMHAYASDHVDFVNNTVYANSRSAALDEEGLASSHSSDVTMFNNVVVARPDKVGGAVTDGAVADYNLYFGGTGTPTLSAHDLLADPLFVDPDCRDFRLQSGSPALDSGLSSAVGRPAADLLDVARPRGAGVDRGAYESR